MIFNKYELDKWKRQFPTIVWQCDDVFLGHVVGFADALGKREELEAKIKQMAFPTFFGSPAHTFVSADDAASFYFEIHLDKHINGLATTTPRPTKTFAMNGGLIFHPAWRKPMIEEDMEVSCPMCNQRCRVHHPSSGGRMVATHHVEGAGTKDEERSGEFNAACPASLTNLGEPKEIADNARGSWSVHT